MYVLLKHPLSGETRRAAVGWSWPLFLATGGLLGIPLFFRGLALWGAIVLALWSLRLAVPLLAGAGATADGMDWAFALLLLGVSAFLGIRGNALVARRYLVCGYAFLRPDSVEARIAAESWGLRSASASGSRTAVVTE